MDYRNFKIQIGNIKITNEFICDQDGCEPHEVEMSSILEHVMETLQAQGLEPDTTFDLRIFRRED